MAPPPTPRPSCIRSAAARPPGWKKCATRTTAPRADKPLDPFDIHLQFRRIAMRLVVRSLLVCGSLVACAIPSAVWAQSDARIVGLVTDGSGAVLPGVTVTASSLALQVGQLTSVTDGTGEYRLTPLPIGT